LPFMRYAGEREEWRFENEGVHPDI